MGGLDTVLPSFKNIDSVYSTILKYHEPKILPAGSDSVLAKSYFYSPLRSLVYNSFFGLRMHPLHNKIKLHAGVDLKAKYEAVYAITDGIIKKARFGDKEGNYIVISHKSIESVYCHLDRTFCKEGQIIKGGSCIAISGNTGSSTGPHLHFCIKYNGVPIDPLIYLKNIYRLNNEN